MKKKGAWGWEIVGKLVLLLIIILVLLAIIGVLTGKSTIVWERIKTMLSFRF